MLVKSITVIVKVLLTVTWPSDDLPVYCCFVDASEYQAKAHLDWQTHAEHISIWGWAATYTNIKHYRRELARLFRLFHMWSLLGDPQGRAFKGAVQNILNIHAFLQICGLKLVLSRALSMLFLDQYQGSALKGCS